MDKGCSELLGKIVELVRTANQLDGNDSDIIYYRTVYPSLKDDIDTLKRNILALGNRINRFEQKQPGSGPGKKLDDPYDQHDQIMDTLDGIFEDIVLK